jgi:hypothetical protein
MTTRLDRQTDRQAINGDRCVLEVQRSVSDWSKWYYFGTVGGADWRV